MLKIGQPFRCDCGEDMATNGFEKTSARHEMQCLALNESFNVECIGENCSTAAEIMGMVYDGR